MKPINDIRVVVIEDRLDNLELITTLLKEDVGIQHCTVWASGQMFFHWYHKSPSVRLNPKHSQIDLILLDLQIPGENGYEVFKRIKQEPSLSQTMVVAVTANIMQEHVEKALGMGFYGFIGKPISVERFPEQIKRILQHEMVWEPH